ncbi:hypothetical protein PABG_04643 [Paracoccidioides brasiliensis Pb03]|nr:hypothetical protein PABG_04643 [Paracoccidioides brasiliensis Pb03]
MWISGFGDVPLAILLAHDGTVITMERQTRSELFDSQINSHRAGIGLFACKGWLLTDFEEQSPDALRIFPPLLHHPTVSKTLTGCYQVKTKTIAPKIPILLNDSPMLTAVV